MMQSAFTAYGRLTGCTDSGKYFFAASVFVVKKLPAVFMARAGSFGNVRVIARRGMLVVFFQLATSVAVNPLCLAGFRLDRSAVAPFFRVCRVRFFCRT